MELPHAARMFRGLVKSPLHTQASLIFLGALIMGVVSGDELNWRTNVPSFPKSVQPLLPASLATQSGSARHHNQNEWYSLRVNDPRLSYFSSIPSVLTTTGSRSLSHLPSNFSKSSVAVRQGRDVLKPSSNKRSKKKTEKIIKKSTAVAAPIQKDWMSSSRTFITAPFLFLMAPVFLAQMFGMGMVPAAAVILLPVFLLPFAMATAIFLI